MLINTGTCSTALFRTSLVCFPVFPVSLLAVASTLVRLWYLCIRADVADSLVVCQTEIRDLSRMCIVLRGQDGVIEQARRQLEDLVSI